MDVDSVEVVVVEGAAVEVTSLNSALPESCSTSVVSDALVPVRSEPGGSSRPCSDST